MKISIKNLGPIKKADIKINDLTIIAGGNNTGKTYIAYAIYGLLKELRKMQSAYFVSESEELIKKEVLTISAEQLKDKRNSIIKKVSERFSANIHNVFSAGKDQFSNTKILIDDYNELFPEYRGRDPIKLDLSPGNLEMKFKENGEIILSFVPKSSDQDMHKEYISYFLYFFLGKGDAPSPFILPAERQSIFLFYKELDIKKNILVEQLQKVSGERDNFDPFEFIEKHTARYALPIKDNIFFTRDIDNISKEESPFLNICDKIETMMGGYFELADKQVRFISKDGEKEKFNIPLYLASTSARGLSDIYFYLKHKAQKGDILIIDEPESHLHPANQIFMARLLALCVNSGLKVFISTHSDYIIREFNNLIMLSNNFDGKEEFLKSNDYGKGDFLKPESVSAYICEKGSLTPCAVDKKGIDMPSFDGTIDKINVVANELDYLTGPIDED